MIIRSLIRQTRKVVIEVGPEVARKLAGVPVGASLELLRNISKMES